MKNKIKLFTCLVLILLDFSLLSCNKHKAYKVHEYKTTTQDASGNNMLLFWYVMMIQNNQGNTYYYSYSSSTPILNSQLSTVSWNKTEELPFEEEQAISVGTEELAIEGISDQQIFNDLQESLAEPDNNEVVSDGGSTPEEENTGTESENSSDEGSSSESGDSGSSDGGSGGDGGSGE